MITTQTLFITSTKSTSTALAPSGYSLSASDSYAEVEKKSTDTSVVSTRKSNISVVPSDVSVEPYMESLSSKVNFIQCYDVVVVALINLYSWKL